MLDRPIGPSKTVLLVVLLVVLLTSSADAHAVVPRVRHSDVVSTRLYLLAMRGLTRIGAREASKAEADIHGLIARVNTQCPNVLAGAPENEVVGDLRFQTLDQVANADSEPMHAAEVAFAKTAERLHWSDRKLDYYVHGSAEETQADAELKVPDICEEARAVVAGKYTTAPAAMVDYEKERQAANSKVTITIKFGKGSGEPLRERILALLRPYERPDEKWLIPRKPTSKQMEQALKIFLGYASELVKALGLSVGAQ